MLIEKLGIMTILALSYILQVSTDFFTLGGIKPDFLLILTIYTSFHKGEFAGLWIGFFAGLLQDINLGAYVSLTSQETNYFIGSNALPKALIGYFTGRVVPFFLSENTLLISSLIFVSNLLKGILFLLILAIFHRDHQLSGFISIILFESLYTAIIGMFWFKLLKSLLPMKGFTQRDAI